MKTLDQIAHEHGTDKSLVHYRQGDSDNHGHGYTPHYDRFFGPFRMERIKVLEIGVGGGESIRTWLEYFPNASIYGVDNFDGSNPWNTVKSGADPRYTFVHGDQSDTTFWRCFIADYGKEWSIIIDDGGHFANQVITTFDAMWRYVVGGGLYCIEDLNVAYGTLFVPHGWQNHMDFIKDKLDVINKENKIDSMYYSRELAIFTKASL